MADLVLTADVSSIRDAEKALKRFSDASEKLGRSVLNTASKVKSVSSGWDQANKLYKQGVLNSKALAAAQTELARELATLNGYTKSNGALNTQRALAELRAAQAARESARATEEAARAAQQAAQRQNELRMRYQEGYAAFARARNEMRGLREAMRAGIITTDQYRERVRLLREEMNRSGDAAQGAGRRMSRTGVLTQQAGYQVGDFIVQVQSGTNAFVAFGQQATQIAGTLTLLGGKWIAIGTALGIAIPLFTAVAAAIMRTRDAMDEAAKKAKFYQERIKSLDDAIQDFLATKEAMALGLTTDELFSLRGLEDAKKALDEATEKVEYLKKIASGEIGPQVMTAKEFSQLGANQVAAEEALRVATERYNIIKEMTDEKRAEFVQNLDRELQLQQEIKRFGEDSLNVADLRLQFQKEDLVAQAEKLGFSKTEIPLLVRKLILTQETLRELEAAERAQKALLEDTSAAGDEMVKAFYEIQTGYRNVAAAQTTLTAETTKYIGEMTEVFNKAQDLREELGDAAYEALTLAGVDITSGVDAAAKAAASLAAAMGQTLGYAIAMQGMMADEDLAMSQTVVKGKTTDRFGVEDLKRFGYTEEYLKSVGKIRPSRGGGGGVVQEDRIGALAQSLATEKELLAQWYEDSLVQISEFNTKELELLGGQNEAKLRLEQEYQSRLAEIQKQQYQGVADAQQGAMSAFQSFMGTLSGMSEGAAKAVLVVNTALSISQAIQNTAVAATRALAELGPVAGPAAAAKIKMYGAAQVGLIAANAALKLGSRGGGSGGGSGGGGGGRIATPATAAATPQRVLIQGIGPNDLITGSQLSEIFDKLYEENENRGLVFQIAS